MTKPGNFHDLIDLLDRLDTMPAGTAKPASQSACPLPRRQQVERSERQWIVSGILRFAFTQDGHSAD
ncbi:MAG: hypothetical protein M3N02_04400 [Pseudomonadota bacterium]|nr:hypothetical protein [Pseudomonadota bacterium]